MPLLPSSSCRANRARFWHIRPAPAFGAGSELERRLPGFELHHLRDVAAERPQRLRRLPRQELAASALGAELAVFHDDLPACQARDRPSFKPPPLLTGIPGAAI